VLLDSRFQSRATAGDLAEGGPPAQRLAGGRDRGVGFYVVRAALGGEKEGRRAGGFNHQWSRRGQNFVRGREAVRRRQPVAEVQRWLPPDRSGTDRFPVGRFAAHRGQRTWLASLGVERACAPIRDVTTIPLRSVPRSRFAPPFPTLLLATAPAISLRPISTYSAPTYQSDQGAAEIVAHAAALKTRADQNAAAYRFVAGRTGGTKD
jgi:hypothetical protein